MKRIMICMSLLVFALCGCNTMSGLGKDLQAGGKAITNAANDTSSSSKKTNTAHVVSPATGSQATVSSTNSGPTTVTGTVNQ